MSPTTPQQRSNLARKAAQARWDKTSSQPAKKSKRTQSSWIETRFCLSLYQNDAGEWRLLTPSGLDIPATNSEISLWLDLESLRFKFTNQ